MEAAVGLFVEGGIRAVTIDEVTARSGVAKTTIYRHWPTREALLLDLFHHFDHGFSAPEPGQPPVERLRVVMRELAATLADPEWRRALPSLLDVARRVDEFAELHERAAPSAGSLSQAILKLIETNVLPANADPREVMAQLAGPLTMTAIFSPVPVDEAFADRLVNRLIAGYAGTGADSTERANSVE